MQEKKKNIDYISILQFIGPIFVILGHSLNGISSSGIWWVFTKRWIYIFHMPLFFMISGYLFTYKERKESYSTFIKKKFMRLMVPYLVWNAAFLIPKSLFQTFLNDSVELNLQYIIKVFITPRQNIWGHTWFLMGLFIVYLFTPLWEKLFSKISYMKIAIVVIIGIVLYAFPVKTEILCLSDLHKDILFFWIGCFLGKADVAALFKRAKLFTVIGLLGAVCTSVVVIKMSSSATALDVVACSFILMALFFASVELSKNGISNTVLRLSRRSFGIYIMHWPVMVTCRVLLLQILKMPSGIVVTAMIIMGYIIPNIVITVAEKIPNRKIKGCLKYLIGV